MEKELADSLTSLRQALVSDPRLLRLNELEREVNADPTVRELSKKLDDLERQYEDVLAYRKPTDPEAISLQKSLYLAKETLDMNPVVKEYNEAYVVVRDLYMQIDDIIFGDFRKKSLNVEGL